jgi:hypothetical protein
MSGIIHVDVREKQILMSANIEALHVSFAFQIRSSNLLLTFSSCTHDFRLSEYARLYRSTPAPSGDLVRPGIYRHVCV